jgi:adenylate cyclase
VGNYLFAAGVPDCRKCHPVDACLGALALRALARRLDAGRDTQGHGPWQLSVGIHTGPATSGVVGTWKFAYELWGQSASLAERISQAAAPDEVLLSESTCHRVRHFFDCVERGSIDAENTGIQDLYSLERIKPELSADPEGTLPNQRFLELLGQRFGMSGIG